MSKLAGRWIEDGAITASKLDTTSSAFTMLGVNVNTPDGMINFQDGSAVTKWTIQRDSTNNSLKVHSNSDGYSLRVQGSVSSSSPSLDVNTGTRKVGIGTTAGSFDLQIGSSSAHMAIGGAPNTNGSGYLYFLNSNSVKNWQLASNDTIPGSFTIMPSTVAGGSTFTTPALTISPAGTFTVAGDATFSSNLAVNGTTTIINTEITSTDKMEIDQAGNQEALVINKSGTGVGTAVRIINAGTSPAMTVMPSGSGSIRVGVGTVSPLGDLDVQGSGVYPAALFGTPTSIGRVYIQGAAINGYYGLDSDAGDLILNYAGYQNGATRYRDTAIYNGRNSPIVMFKGSTSCVGIGTTNPQVALDIWKTNNPALYVTRVTGTSTNAIASFNTDTGEKVRICYNGLVGIGTANPLSNIHVNGSQVRVQSYGSSWAAFLAHNGTNSLDMGVELAGGSLISGSGANETVFSCSGAYKMHFGTSSTIRMTINSVGLVGIGTTAPQFKLHVQTSEADGGISVFDNTSGYEVGRLFRSSTTSEGRLILRSANVIKVDVNANSSSYFNGGNVGIGTSNPYVPLQLAGGGVASFFSTQRLNRPTGVIAIGSWTMDAINNDGDRRTAVELVARSESAWNAGDDNPSTFQIYVGSSTGTRERLKITSAGYVGIGTSNPQAPLDVYQPSTMGTQTPGWNVTNDNTTHSTALQRTLVSTVAVTIATIGQLGALCIVTGYASGNGWTDLVMCGANGVAPAVVFSYSNVGAPPARTYTSGGTNILKLAVASGSYNVGCFQLAQSY